MRRARWRLRRGFRSMALFTVWSFVGRLATVGRRLIDAWRNLRFIQRGFHKVQWFRSMALFTVWSFVGRLAAICRRLVDGRRDLRLVRRGFRRVRWFRFMALSAVLSFVGGLVATGCRLLDAWKDLRRIRRGFHEVRWFLRLLGVLALRNWVGSGLRDITSLRTMLVLQFLVKGLLLAHLLCTDPSQLSKDMDLSGRHSLDNVLILNY